MKKELLLGLFLMFIFAASGWSQEPALQSDPPASMIPDISGKTAFVNNKCNLCHSIEAEKVEKMSGGYQKSKEKNVPPDLSGIGQRLKSDWIVRYLKKTEALEGVKHPRLYRGTEKEVQELAKWLEGLK